MTERHLHFSETGLAARRQRAIAAMAEAALDGLLLFKQESRYYLTGYDTGAHTYFQCLYLGADGAMTLLCRLPDVRQAAFTSVIADVRYWADSVDARPGEVLMDILAEHGALGARLGVETDCLGMTAEVWRELSEAGEGVCDLVDASRLVDRLRLAKSPAERAYIEQAAALADAALRRAVEMAKPGVETGAILAETQGKVYEGGGQAAATNWLIASGAEAGLLGYHSGRRVLEQNDVLQLRLSGVMRRYHAPVMRACAIGAVDDDDRRLHDIRLGALDEMRRCCQAGAMVGDVYQAYIRGLGAMPDGVTPLDRCGHAVGATYAPSAADWPAIRRGSPVTLQAGMVFYLEAAIIDERRGLALGLGETIAVTEAGADRLSSFPLEGSAVGYG